MRPITERTTPSPPAQEQGSSRLWRGLWLCVALMLLAFLLVRHIDAPLLDRHSWRQTDTAGFARGLYQGRFDVLNPRFLAVYPDAYGLDGAVETEFNLYPLIVAGLYRVFGEHEAVARAVSVACSLASVVSLYAIGRRLVGEAAARWAALLLSLSPLFVFYGRTVQPDAMALSLSLGGFWCFLRWLERERWTDYVLAAVGVGLALLVKVPSLYIGVPMLAAVLAQGGFPRLRDGRLWLLLLLTVGPMIAYYARARSLFRASGLSVYGLSGGWPGSGKFDLAGQLVDPTFYRTMLSRLRGAILARSLFWPCMLGLAMYARERRAMVLYAWLVALLAFVLGAAQGHRQHEYYQLPLVPVLALFTGRALAWVWRPTSLRVPLWFLGPRLGIIVCALAVGFGMRSTWRELAPRYAQSETLLDVASAVERLTPSDAPVVILHDWARVPEVFYYAHRRGWSLWIERRGDGTYDRLIVAERERDDDGWRIVELLDHDIARIEKLRSQGASALAVSLEKGTIEAFASSPVGRALGARYSLLGQGEHWLVYDLTATCD